MATNTTTRSARRSAQTSTDPSTETAAATERQTALAEATETTGQAVGQVADTTRTAIVDQADRQRFRAADSADQVAGAIRRVSGELESEQPGIASVVDTAAQQTERIGRYLRETDAEQILTGVQDFARRQPLVFFGGAFVLGLAAARFIKAGSTEPANRYQATGYSRRTPVEVGTSYEPSMPVGS